MKALTTTDLMLFTGNANPDLAKAIAESLGLPISQAIVGEFSDGETMVQILENVRGRDVFIIQSICPPASKNLMELILMTDALRRASAGRITAVIPYFGYARQDRRVRSARVPITARVVADMLTTAGVDRILTVDIHAEQIQGFFQIPLDNIYGSPILLDYIQKRDVSQMTVVSPDMGGVARARAIAKRLNCELAIIDKRRPRANEAQVMNVIGDIQGRHCLIVDDIVDTAGTLCKAAQALMDRGALSVSAYCIHPVFSGNAFENIHSSCLTEVVVTDTIPLSAKMASCDKVKQLSLAKLLSLSISRINTEESISELFSDYT